MIEGRECKSQSKTKKFKNRTKELKESHSTGRV